MEKRLLGLLFAAKAPFENIEITPPVFIQRISQIKIYVKFYNYLVIF